MPGKETSGGFSAVDRAADPVAYVQYLGTVSGMEATQAYKRQSFALLDGKPGARLLDVGCGTGDDAWALASMVGEGGLVIGIDSRETMIAEAVRRSKGSDLGLELRVGDVHRLDFPDATFDVCRTDRTLQYVDDPRAALAEMIRVVRAGARIVASEPDWATLVIDAPDRALTRRLLNFYCDHHRNGWIGRQLAGLFHQAGLLEVGIMPTTLVVTDYAVLREAVWLPATLERARQAGVVSESEVADWLAPLEEASRAGRFSAR